MPADPCWRERAWILSPTAATLWQQRLAPLAAGVTVASRSDGGADLTVWTCGRAGAALAPLLRQLPAPAIDRRHRESALMAAYAPDGPCELAPGVWVSTTPRQRLPRGALRLVVPPAAAFGDGRHPSTRLAAAAMLRIDLRRRRVLDLGCGTGVLGVLAHRQGAARVDFADIDAGSVRSCRAVCRLNGLVRPRVWQADLLDGVAGQGYDVVLGNLYADLCLRLLADPRLAAVLPAGVLLLSGVADRRRAQVERALVRAGFVVTGRSSEAWWSSLTAERRPVR
jgi:ribosomal protein L11 methyltransferase